jgi:hypothetical protein
VKRHEDGSNIYAVEKRSAVGSVGDNSSDKEKETVQHILKL